MEKSAKPRLWVGKESIEEILKHYRMVMSQNSDGPDDKMIRVRRRQTAALRKKKNPAAHGRKGHRNGRVGLGDVLVNWRGVAPELENNHSHEILEGWLWLGVC